MGLVFVGVVDNGGNVGRHGTVICGTCNVEMGGKEVVQPGLSFKSMLGDGNVEIGERANELNNEANDGNACGVVGVEGDELPTENNMCGCCLARFCVGVVDTRRRLGFVLGEPGDNEFPIAVLAVTLLTLDELSNGLFLLFFTSGKVFENS